VKLERAAADAAALLLLCDPALMNLAPTSTGSATAIAYLVHGDGSCCR